MLSLTTTIDVEDMTAREVFEFLADPTDEAYQAWWPGTHLEFHVVRRGRDHVGDVVHMDEYVGERRLRMDAVVTAADPGRRLVWRMRKGVGLPAHLHLDLEDRAGGVTITHTTRAGFGGAGRILDPVLRRLYFTPRFVADLDAHVRTEFPRLRDLLRRPAGG